MTLHEAVPWSPPNRLQAREVFAISRGIFSVPPTGPQPPPGVRRPVLLLPGFLAGDWTLRPMARYLRRYGHQTFTCGIRWNVDCTSDICQAIAERVIDLHRAVGPLAIVGHSRGGTLARVVAGRHSELVTHVVSLAGPLTSQFAGSRTVLDIAQRIADANPTGERHTLDEDCLEGACALAIDATLQQRLPDSVALTSIYSPDDGVVRWRSCLPPEAKPIVVEGTHNGLASSRLAMFEVLKALRPADFGT